MPKLIQLRGIPKNEDGSKEENKLVIIFKAFCCTLLLKCLFLPLKDVGY